MTNGSMHEQMHNPKAIRPFKFVEVGGIKNAVTEKACKHKE